MSGDHCLIRVDMWFPSSSKRVRPDSVLPTKSEVRTISLTILKRAVRFLENLSDFCSRFLWQLADFGPGNWGAQYLLFRFEFAVSEIATIAVRAPKALHLQDRRTRMASLRLTDQSSPCMGRKLFLKTALPMAFPSRSPAAWSVRKWIPP
jgi:hypothetical protein